MVQTSINQITSNSFVFLTGVTGFVGGCLLERICRLVPGPVCIYVLVRRKHDIDADCRLKKVLSSPLFAKVPSYKLKRVIALEGDIGFDGNDLGLSKSDSNRLLETCTHIYHVAAFISFAAQLDQAIKINLRGTKAVLDLAHRMKKLKAMVHVSTAYANCTIGNEYASFNEIIYPVNIDPLQFLDTVSNMPLQDIEQKYAKLIKRHPNTYSFTKKMTENLLARERGKIPLSIVRPGIILNSWREPFPGWVDNVNSGACGFIAGAGKGIFCTLQARNDMVMDIIPVDLVVSTILAATLKAERDPERVHVFHCTSGTVNPTTWSRYCDGIIKASRKHPCKNAAWYPRASLRESRLRNDLVILIFQMLPGYFIDLFARITKPGYKVFELQRRYAKGNKYTSYFSMREWQFIRTAADELAEILPREEREEHPMDPRFINWDNYFETCVIGTRTYFHKEPLKTSTEAQRRMAVLYVIAVLVPVLSFIGASYLMFLMGIQFLLALPIAASVVLTLMWL